MHGHAHGCRDDGSRRRGRRHDSDSSALDSGSQQVAHTATQATPGAGALGSGTAHRRRWRRPGLRLVVLALALTLTPLLAACGGGSGAASPVRATATSLPPVDAPLEIDGATVQRLLVPDPKVGPTYAVTNAWLYINRGSGWERTETTADGRWLLADPTDPERIFRGDHAPCTTSATGASTGMATTSHLPRLERSSDGGTTWVELPGGDGVRPLAIDPTIPEVIYGSACQLMISENNGGSWKPVTLPEDPPIVTLLVEHERLLQLERAADGRSVLRPVDITVPEEPEPGDVLLETMHAVCLDVHESRIIVAGGDRVHISDDGGFSWTERTLEPQPPLDHTATVNAHTATSAATETAIAATNTAAAGAEATADVQPMQILAVRIDSARPSRIYVGTNQGLFLSQDDGATWVRYDELLTTIAIRQIDLAADGADLYLTTDDAVWLVSAP